MCYNIKGVEIKITRVNCISVKPETGKEIHDVYKTVIIPVYLYGVRKFGAKANREIKLQRAEMKFQESSWPHLELESSLCPPPPAPFVDAATYKKSYFLCTLLVYILEYIYTTLIYLYYLYLQYCSVFLNI